jgi:hypothetical protein
VTVEQQLYKDISLFNDVEDEQLRAYNRGQVLANFAVDGRGSNGKLSITATKDILEYFGRIPLEERDSAMDNFIVAARKRGFNVAGVKQ